MAGRKIFFPYNFTPQDHQALDFVVQTFAERDGAEVILFNAYIPAPKIEVRGSPIMEKMGMQAAQMNQRINEQEKALEKARDRLVEGGFAPEKVRIVYEARKKDPGADIVGVALREGVDHVVLNRTPGKIARFFTGSVFTKVVTGLKGVTVSIVS